MKKLWQRWGWVVRWGGTAFGIAYIVMVIDLESIKRAFHAMAFVSFAAAIGSVCCGVGAGVLRWRALLRAYGAQAVPSLMVTTRLYVIATFYNTYLPGGLVGDVMRGVVSRESFGEHGTTGAMAVVLIERALGLFALFVIVAAGLLITDISDAGSLWMWTAVGLVAAVAAVFALPFGRKLARFLPGPLSRIAERLPTVTRPYDFAAATALSLVTQLAAAMAGWLLLHDVDPHVSFSSALLVVPLAAATAYLPVTVGGAGAREAVFITLCAKLFGMPSHDALAASLMLWFAILIVSATGGVWQLLSRKAIDPDAVVDA
jgi:glycosyltransferase 2 family protein